MTTPHKGEGGVTTQQQRQEEESHVGSNRRILSIGLNPAYQKVLQFPDGFLVNHVNRATSSTPVSGGKGQNFCRAANTIKKGSSIVAQFLGGSTGEFISNTLSGEGIDQLTVWVDEAPTRTCTTCLCGKTKQMTEVIEPSGVVPEHKVQEMLDRIRNTIGTIDVAAIVICGTFPPGVPNSFYTDIASLKKKDTIVLLDGYKGVDHLIQSGNVYILKINAFELTQLAQMDTSPHDIEEDVILKAGKTVFDKFEKLRFICITDGARDAYLFASPYDRSSHYVSKFSTPKLSTSELVNPIGAGDACNGVLISKLLETSGERGISRSLQTQAFELQVELLEEAFRLGLTAASASCLELVPSKFSMSDVDRLLKETQRTVIQQQ